MEVSKISTHMDLSWLEQLPLLSGYGHPSAHLSFDRSGEPKATLMSPNHKYFACLLHCKICFVVEGLK